MDAQASRKRHSRAYWVIGGLLLAGSVALAAWWQLVPAVPGNSMRAFILSSPPLPRIAPKVFGVLVLPIAGDAGNTCAQELAGKLNQTHGVEAHCIAQPPPAARVDDIPGRRAAYALLERTGARLLVTGGLEGGLLSMRFMVRPTRSPDYNVFAYFPEELTVATSDQHLPDLVVGLRMACDAAKWSGLSGPFDAAILPHWVDAARQRLAEGDNADIQLDSLRRGLADALLVVDGEQGGAKGAREALSLYRILVSRESPEHGGTVDSYLRVNFGLCLMHLVRAGDRTLAGEAVEVLQSALAILEPEHGPMPKARVAFALGAAMEFLAAAGRNAKRLEESTMYYRLALTAMTREKTPWLNAVVNKRLGGVLNERFRRDGDIATARQARDAFAWALMYFDRQRDKASYAWCQSGLGQAKSNIAAKSGDIQQYEESAVAYAEAASVTAREQQGRYLGSLHYRLGLALYNAAKQSPRENRYEKALEAFDLAMANLDSGQDSREWLRSVYHRGVILSDEGYRRADMQRLTLGGDAYKQGLAAPALKNDRVLLSWFSSRLGRNCTDRYDISGDVSLLDKGQEAYAMAQSLTVKDKDLPRWASLQHNLAWIAAEKAETSGVAGDMERAADMYRQASEARRGQPLDDNLVRQIAGEVAMLRAAGITSGNSAMLLQAEALSRNLAARSADSPLAVVRSGGKACLGIHLRVVGVKENNIPKVEEGLRWLTEARQDLAKGDDPRRHAYLSLGMARCKAWLAAAESNPYAACQAIEALEDAWSTPLFKTGPNAKDIRAVLSLSENALRGMPPAEAGCLETHARTIAAIKAVTPP